MQKQPEIAPEPPTTRDETDDLGIHSLPGPLIRRLQQVAVSIFVEAAEAAGAEITPVQFAALRGIAAHPGIDQASLGRLIAYDRTTIGGVIDRLEAKGLVSRSSSSKDRRALQLVISEKGSSLLEILTPVIGTVQDRIVEPLTQEERAIFMMLLRKLVDSSNERSRSPLRPPSRRATRATPA